MASRIAAGCAFPSDTKAGFELGKRVAEKQIELTKDFISKKQWDGKMPQDAGLWKGKNPMLPLTGLNKTMVLDSASQFSREYARLFGAPPLRDVARLKSGDLLAAAG